MTNWADTYFGAGTYPPDWVDKIKSRLEGTTVLDLCCGSGRFTNLFDPRGYLGIDVSKINIEGAKAASPLHKFIRADIVKWDTKRRFDNVFTWVALQHIEPKYFTELAKKI